MAKGIGSVSIKPDEEWEVENALHTLTEAKKIRADKALMAKVKVMARQKLEAVASVVGDMAKDD